MKQSYKIPASLNTSYMDMTITIQKDDGLGLKPLPMKQLAFFLAVLFSGFFIQQKTFVGQCGTVLSVLFLAVYFGIGLYLGLMDSSHVLRFEMVPAMLSYIQPDHRKIFKVPISFYNIADIDERGFITYADGTYGCICSVVGTASVLLFDSDREAILNRVDMFWRKQIPNVEYIFITVKKSQDVTSQRKHIRTYDMSDKELRQLAKDQDIILRDYVGNEFKSIHQYMMLKAPNKEVLRQSYNILQSEVENSSYMIKRCVQLHDETIVSIVNTIF